MLLFLLLIPYNLNWALGAISEITALESELRQGEESYFTLLKNTELPVYGDCWTTAVRSLKEGCENLCDKKQSKLALEFANCLLDMTGQNQVVCSDHEDLRDCLSRMEDRAFTVYQNFFTSTRSMCQFLRIQVWHEETERTIGRLATNSDQVATKLSESKEIQDSIVEAQKKTFDELKQQTEMSKQNIKQMFDNLQDRTEQHGALIFEIFDRIGKLQSYVLGEVESFYSVFFYLSAMLLSYLTTSVPRTSGARLLLFSLILLSFFSENAIRKIVINGREASLKNVEDLQEVIRYWTGTIRYISSTLCLVSLIACAWRFRDYNKLNHRLLMEIQKQNYEVKTFLETLGSRAATGRVDVTDAPSLAVNGLYPTAISYGLEFNDSYTESSYDTDSDETYIPDSENDDDDCSVSRIFPPEISPQDRSPGLTCREVMPYLKPEPKPSHIERVSGTPSAPKPRPRQTTESAPASVPAPLIFSDIEHPSLPPNASRATTLQEVHEPRYSLRSRGSVTPVGRRRMPESPEEFFAIVKMQEELAVERRKQLLKKLARDERR